MLDLTLPGEPYVPTADYPELQAAVAKKYKSIGVTQAIIEIVLPISGGRGWQLQTYQWGRPCNLTDIDYGDFGNA